MAPPGVGIVVVEVVVVVLIVVEGPRGFGVGVHVYSSLKLGEIRQSLRPRGGTLHPLLLLPFRTPKGPRKMAMVAIGKGAFLFLWLLVGLSVAPARFSFDVPHQPAPRLVP